MPTKNNVSFIIAICAIAILGVFIYVRNGMSGPATSDNVVLPQIRLAYNINSLDTVPLIIAYQKGYFKEQGIEVKLTQVTGSDGAVAIGSGQQDMVIIGSPRLFGPIDKNAPVKLLAPMSNTYSELLIRPDSGINTLKELEGKNVSFGSAGGTKELLLKSILKSENVDLSKINFIVTENNYLHIALMDKKVIDVALISDAGFIDAAKKLNAVVLPEWQTKNYHTFSTGLIVAANSDYLNSHTDTVTSFFKAIIEANRYLKSNLEDAAIISMQFFKDNTNGATDIKPADFMQLVTSGQVSYLLWEDTTAIEKMATTSFELGQTQKSLTQADLYDLRFKDMLAAAQNEIYGQGQN